jgi:hypothetical protein
MENIFNVVSIVARGMMLLITVPAVPVAAVGIIIDSAIRAAFRGSSIQAGLLDPLTSWSGFRPYILAWFFTFAPTSILWNAGPVVFEDFSKVSSTAKLWSFLLLGCLVYFAFARKIAGGAPKKSSGTISAIDLASAIKADIYGQDDNIDSITSLIAARSARPRDRGPVATFMLAGPTGTGKTETARLIAKQMGLPIFIVRCNEFSNQWGSVERLIGAQGAYKNSEQGGELTNALMASPRGVLVLDEIEKADQSVSRVLMTLLDEGTITMAANGQIVNAQGWIMFATTNAAHEEIAEITETATDVISLRIGIKDALQSHWPPEILGRFDLILAFRRVTDQDEVSRQMVQKALNAIYSRLDHVHGSMTDEAEDFMVDASQRVGKYGFRELERYLEEVTMLGLAGAPERTKRNPVHLEYYVEGNSLRTRIITPRNK